jgi:hypothetical protein
MSRTLRTLRFVALTLVALSIGLTISVNTMRPAYAATMTMCQHTTSIASLRACILHCDTMGYITDHALTEALLYGVDSAQTAVDQGWTDAALTNLQIVGTILQVESGHRILAVHAMDMLKLDQAIMQSI